jgi:DNA gyrase/topoisomerase IV subunit A
MITRARIEDWIRQVQAAPAAGPIIIRQITDRMLELDAMNETLRAENLELTSGNRVREFEKKISELEFQIDLLRRQVGPGQPSSGQPGSGQPIEAPTAVQMHDLLLFNDHGQLLHFQLAPSALVDRTTVARVGSSAMPEAYRGGLVATSLRDRLLFLYSSGRTADLALEDIPIVSGETLDWDQSHNLQIRSMEELVAVIPITKLSWASHAIQVSRFGYARRLANSYLQSFISSHNTGKGVKFDFDRVLNLVLCNEEDLFVAVSKAGTVLSQSAGNVPVSLGEMIRFKVGDFLVAAFTLDADQSLLAVTQSGVAYRHPASLYQTSKPAERKTRSVGSEKSEAGPLAGALAGAAAAGNEDWGVILSEDGALEVFKASEISVRGTPLGPRSEARVLAVTVLTPQKQP